MLSIRWVCGVPGQDCRVLGSTSSTPCLRDTQNRSGGRVLGASFLPQEAAHSQMLEWGFSVLVPLYTPQHARSVLQDAHKEVPWLGVRN